jgi:hypothetical protein
MSVLGDGEISKPNNSNLKKFSNLHFFIASVEGEFIKPNKA